MAEAIEQIPLARIDGANAALGDYAGKVRLVVNVASKCGLTPQYDALEKIYAEYRARGFVVLGFPANDFAGQEPGSNDELATFCRSTYGVDFPMLAKVVATGARRHPLYSALRAEQHRAEESGEGLRETQQGTGITPH